MPPLRLKKKYAKDWDEVGEEERERRAKEIRDLRAVYTKLPRYDARDTGFKKIQYTRYCDDFLIGVIGSKEDAETIKAEVKKFLAEELNLTISDEKTKITHTSDCAEFLGYRIKISRNEGIKRRKDGVKTRPFSGVVKLYVPKENWRTMADKPVQRTSLKEKLEAFKVKAAGAEKQEIGKAKGKEEML